MKVSVDSFEFGNDAVKSTIKSPTSQLTNQNTYYPGDLTAMEKSVSNDPIKEFCISERAKYCTAYGSKVTDNPERSGESDQQLEFQKALLSRWKRFGWGGSFEGTLRSIVVDRLIYGRGFAELMRNQNVISYIDYTRGEVSRREIGSVAWLPRVNVRQMKPREVIEVYGGVSISRYDHMDLLYPILAYTQSGAMPLQTGRAFFKRFGDPRYINRYTGEATTEEALDANEWIDLKRPWATNPIDGRPEHMAADDTGDINYNAILALKNFFRNNCIPNYVIRAIGFEDDDVGTGQKQLKNGLQTQFNGIAQARGNEGYRNRIIVITIPPVSKDMHPVTLELQPLNPMDNLKDLLDLWKTNNLMTAMIMGMPPRILNQITQGNLGGAGDALGQLQQLITFTVTPDLNDINSQLLDPLVYQGLGIGAYLIRMNTPQLSDPTTEAQNAKTWSETKLPYDAWLGKVGLPTLGQIMESEDYDPGKNLMIQQGTQILTIADLERLNEQSLSLPEGSEQDRATEQLKALLPRLPIKAIHEVIPQLREKIWSQLQMTSITDLVEV